MTVIVEITNPQARSISGISKKTGNEYSFKVQGGYLHSADDYPEKFEYTLRDGQVAYPKGFYELSDRSIYVDRQGHLAVGCELVAGAVAPK
jgi:hypothetical protein